MEVYVRDLAQGRTIWASRGVSAYFAAWGGGCLSAVLSDDGRFVAFKAVAPDNQSVKVFRYDLETDTTLLLATNANYVSPPDISPEGRFVAFESGSNVVVWDGQTGPTILARESLSGAPGRGPSHTPMLATNGTRVAFLSDASDRTLVGGNGLCQMYVRDLVTRRTALVSARLDGGPSGSDLTSIIPTLSADGGQALFESDAAGLWPADSNAASDVFLSDLSSVTWFGANDRPVLQVRSQPIVTLLWTPVPGHTGHAQYRENLNSGAWTDLPDTVIVNGTVASQTDYATGPKQRFYRLVLE